MENPCSMEGFNRNITDRGFAEYMLNIIWPIFPRGNPPFGES